MDLDEGMVADYNDDINTLLTFVRHLIAHCSLLIIIHVVER